MEHTNFASFNTEIASDISGTEMEPRLVRVITGQKGVGAVFVIKIGKNFFRACEEFNELGHYPIYFPFVPCEYEQ